MIQNDRKIGKNALFALLIVGCLCLSGTYYAFAKSNERVKNQSWPQLGYEGVLKSVASLNAKNAWAVGSQNGHPLIEHWNGILWQIVPNPEEDVTGSLNAVAVFSQKDAWAVGGIGKGSLLDHNTLIEHWDGERWQVIDSSYGFSFNAIDGRASNDIWAVSFDYLSGGRYTPVVVHWNGSAWQTVSGLGGYESLHGVAELAQNNVWTVGDRSATHWDGKSWRRFYLESDDANCVLNSISAINAHDIWATGSDRNGPVLAHWDGTQWTMNPFHFDLQPIAALSALKAISKNNVWIAGTPVAGGSSLVEHWNGKAWKVVSGRDPLDSSYTYQLTSIAPISNERLWAVGTASQEVSSDTWIDNTFIEVVE